MSNFTCPFCWRESPVGDSHLVCINPTAAVGQAFACAGYLRRDQLDVAQYLSFYQTKFDVDLAPLLAPDGPWNSGLQLAAGTVRPVLFARSKVKPWYAFHKDVHCPICRADAQALEAACPQCLESFPQRVLKDPAAAASVAVIGLAGSGKTCWLASLIGQPVGGTTPVIGHPRFLSQAQVLAISGTLPYPRALFERTPDLPHPCAVSVHERAARKGLALFRDVPGERIQDWVHAKQGGDTSKWTQVTHKVQSLCHRARRMVVMLNASNLKTEIAQLTPLIEHLAAERHDNVVDRLAVCVSALDALGMEATQPVAEWHNKANSLVRDSGLLNRAAALCGETSRVRVFGLSALGRSPVDVKLGDVVHVDHPVKTQVAQGPMKAIDGPMSPFGVLDPLYWLVRAAGPADDPQLGVPI